MAYSSHFKGLESRINALRTRFLPTHFSKTGKYADNILDGARAFRVLCHAELEHYFEIRVMDIAESAFNFWKGNGRASPPLVHLVCNTVGDQGGLPKKLGTNVTATKLVGKSVAQFRHTVDNNHGIRIENLMQLLLPVGVQENDIEPDWLSTVDGFGAKRGKAAHTSCVTYEIDPKDDFDTVTLILDGTKEIDTSLNKIKKAIR